MEEPAVVEGPVGYCNNRDGTATTAVGFSSLGSYFYFVLLLAENEEVEDLEDSCSVQNEQHHEPGHRLK